MKNIQLRINTSDQKITRVSLVIDGVVNEKTSDSVLLKSQMTLRLVEILLDEQHIDISSIGTIEVFEGPGSFTGLRVGVSIANALSCMLKLPINGKNMPASVVY